MSVTTLPCGLRGTRLFCFGSNIAGQLARDPAGIAQSIEPVEIDPAAEWKQVSAGRFFTCAVRIDGSLFCWGDNGSGQLGLGDLRARTSPFRVCF